MRHRKKLMIFVFFVVSILAISNVFALGVAPGKQVVDFKSGETKQLRLIIINNEHQTFKALISVRGELSEYITLYDSIVQIDEDDKEKFITFTLSMPEVFNKPGIHEAEVIITILPSDAEKSQTVVGAYPAVISKVQLRVPYPDKYLDSVFQIYDTDVGDVTNFVLILSNFGMDEVKEAKADISIFNQKNEKVLQLQTNKESLKPNQLKKLVAKQNLNLPAGPYKAIAVFEYDGVKQKLEKDFMYGSIKIDILAISLDNFNLGAVVPFNILVRNLWGEPIKDVFAGIIIKDKSSIISQFKTITVDSIMPLSYKNITGYWDSRNVAVGDYVMDIIIHYGNKVSINSFNISVSVDDARINTVGKVTTKLDKGSDSNISISTLTVLVLLLIIINVSLFYYIKRLAKK